MIKEFNGYEICPENIDGTAEWFYNLSPRIYADDVLCILKNSDFDGNHLYLININGRIFEPVKREKNVLLDQPVFNTEDNTLSFVKYDFNKCVIQIITYNIEADKCSVTGEVSLFKGGDLININILQNSYFLVKQENSNNTFNILYPFEKTIQLEENEGAMMLHDNQLISFKWYEDPDYREETIFRDLDSAQIIERKNGTLILMPNGEIWMMCR